MEGKIIFNLNEKLDEGNKYEISINKSTIGTISYNHTQLIHTVSELKNYTISIKNDETEKEVDVTLNEQYSVKNITVIATQENNKYYFYMIALLIYIAVIIVCYFILDLELYYVLILLVLALPLIIANLLNKNSKNNNFKIKVS